MFQYNDTTNEKKKSTRPKVGVYTFSYLFKFRAQRGTWFLKSLPYLSSDVS